LWRLADEGVDVGNRWFSLSDAFERPWQPGFCPYVDLHAAMAHLRAGQGLRADRLMRSVELGAAENHPSGIRTRNVTMPLLRAIDVWGGSDRHAASGAPTNLRPLLDAAGGSRIQMQLLFCDLER
jgi:hypothetical protein